MGVIGWDVRRTGIRSFAGFEDWTVQEPCTSVLTGTQAGADLAPLPTPHRLACCEVASVAVRFAQTMSRNPGPCRATSPVCAPISGKLGQERLHRRQHADTVPL